MKYFVETSLSSFEFWSGGRDRAKLLTSQQLDEIEPHLEELLGEEFSDTEINDLFWFDFETVCNLIGLWYNEDGDVIENKEEWAREIIGDYQPDIWEDYFDEFWYDCEDEARGERQLKELFDQYLSDNWLDHANEVLEEKFPDADEELRDEFACEHWQNCGSDDWNCERFKKWIKEE